MLSLSLPSLSWFCANLFCYVSACSGALCLWLCSHSPYSQACLTSEGSAALHLWMCSHSISAYYSATLKSQPILVRLLKGHTAGLCSLWDTLGRIWSQKLYCFDGEGLHCLFEAIGELQKIMSLCVVGMDDYSCIIIHWAWSMICIFHSVKIGCLTEVSVIEMPVSDFPGN